MKAQKRTLTFGSDFQVRAEGDQWIIKGYALKYNERTSLGKFDEEILPGAADNCMGDDVRCLLNHDGNQILGRTASGTCSIGHDEIGVWYECQLNSSNPVHQACYESVKRGDISQSSFAFSIAAGGAVMEKDETTGRMEIGRAHV